ncbi:MAG: type II secretion system F family protein [Armatimonadota bacterium]
MPQFEYQAQSRSGERVSGTVTAADARAAARELREGDLFPVRIAQAGPSSWGASVRHHLRPVAPSHHAQFFTQLASLLRSGVNAHDAFDELSAAAADGRLARVAAEISERVAEGAPLADEFARYPALFPDYVAGLVAAGEQLGALPEMLQELADQFEAEARLRGRLKWLRVYYGAVLVLALLVAPFPWVVSRGVGWYAEIAATRLAPILVGAVALIFVFRALRAVPAYERLRSRVVLALPVFGSLLRWAGIARFMRTLNFAQRSGVTFHQALELAGEAAGYAPMRRSAADAATRVRTGTSLDEAVSQMCFLPRRVRQMIAGGERTGDLERRFDAAADFATERREAAVNAISSGTAGVALAGSAVIVLIALVVAWRSYYDALFELAGF